MAEWIAHRYKKQGLIGSGGMGRIYRAYDRLTGNTVALKEVHLKMQDALDVPHQQQALVTLAQEFRIAATLRHPYIVSVLDYGVHAGSPFYTMTYLDQPSSLIDASQDADFTTRVRYLSELLQALIYLHQNDILHRDIKPENILIADDTVQVVDFGLSMSVQDAKSRAGTLAYMAPEILMTGQAVKESDLYAVGVLAYQIFVGQHPFISDDITSILNDDPDMTLLDNNSLQAVIACLLHSTLSISSSIT